jgi:SAM-dependent methyltransferase
VRMIRNCPACLSDRHVLLFTKDEWRIRACRSCGTWFVGNPPSAEQLHTIYREGYFTERLAQHSDGDLQAVAWQAAVGNARRRLSLIRRYAPKAGRLLDVGCGTGAFLSVAREAYRCCGVDVSAEAIAVVLSIPGVEAHVGDLRVLGLAADQFDVVTLFDVIEHVPEPAELLLEAQRLVAPGGIIVLTTGDNESLASRLSGRWWHLLTPPEHLTFFSRAGLRQMAGRCQLTVEHTSHQPVLANVGYMATKLAVEVGAPLRWLPRLVGACGLAGVDLDVNLLDVLTMIMRRS